MDTKPQPIEDFYGVYLLCSQSDLKKYRNRCYIGFTVNPNRRIIQHNRGKEFGGAKKTNNRGPWKMVMIIHGFPNNILALQFEWAWQKPSDSSRLKNIVDIGKKKRNESYFDHNFRILSEMLGTGPWKRMPLKIRWLSNDYIKEFLPNKKPPIHMEICYGHVMIKKKPKQTEEDLKRIDSILMSRERLMECHLCMREIENPLRSRITCIQQKCKLTCHIVCLANHCLGTESGHYVPVEGDCPICEVHFLWGDLIRKKNGCNDLMDDNDEDDLEEVETEAESGNKFCKKYDNSDFSDNDDDDIDRQLEGGRSGVNFRDEYINADDVINLSEDENE